MPSIVLQQLETYGPDHCEVLNDQQASDYVRQLAKQQYENFTVVSWFLPKRLRADFGHIYAFCRWADDLGDETGDHQESLRLLDWWQHELDLCYQGKPRHPVFVALRQTIERHDIPRQPFDDLINAFVQDQTVTRYDDWQQVLDYCKRSADPVGRLVLYMAGHRDPAMQQLSDATCTGLQLANFWQDVRRDVLERDRVYLPRDVAASHELDIDLMAKAIRQDEAVRQQAVKCRACPDSPAMHAMKAPFAATMRELVERTWPMFHKGRELWPMLEPDIRLDIKLFTWGGESVLTMIQRNHYDTLTSRPSVSAWRKAGLMLRGLLGKWTG